MAKNLLQVTDRIDTFVTRHNQLTELVGDLANLQTSVDSDIVGSLNQVFNLVNQDSDFRSKFSLSFTGGDGAASYDSDTGIFSVTGPSAAEARAHVSANFASGDGAFAYNSTSGVFTMTGPSAAEARAHISVTDAGGDGSAAYNASTGVITYTGPSASEARAHISVTDAGGDGALAYNASTGVITYTGPSASEARAHLSGSAGINYNSTTGAITIDSAETRALFSAGEGIDISSGAISGEDATTSNKGIASFSSTNFSTSSGAVSVKADGISSTELKDLSTLLIKNAAGSTLKTIHGAGS